MCFRPTALLVIFALAQAAAAQAPSGVAAAPTPEQPKDPKELLQLVARLNGIAGNDQKPWHMKFSFTLFDPDGKEINHGTYDEYWAAAKHFKIVETDDKFSEADYGTENGVVRSGEAVEIPQSFNEVSDKFLHPLANYAVQLASTTAKVEVQERQFGQVKLRCIMTTEPAANSHSIDTYGPTTCIDPDIPAVRILGPLAQGRLVVFDNIASFRGRYVARDITVKLAGKPEINAHLDTLESVDAVNEALFTPPPDAKPLTPIAPLSNAGPEPGQIPKIVSISAGIAVGRLIRASPPFYPIWAKQNGISGTVVIQAKIGKDGHVYDAHAISGPDELRGAAVDAVKHWVYKPYVLNGEPVEVLTTVNVIFTLGH